MSTAPIQINESSQMQEPKLWRSGDSPNYVETMPQTNGVPLNRTYQRIQKYDLVMCKAWRDEIKHLLIFAGLFSAIVTAFILDSYKWLRRDNSLASVELLSRISLQLGAIANNTTPVLPHSTVLDGVFVPTSRSVRINIVWFTSLGMCLSTVIFGILFLQWLREYTRPISLSPVDAIATRQMRFDGLVGWHVPILVNWLPDLLNCSVLLFFVGVLDLLWSLNNTVAAVMTIMVAGVLFILFIMNFAPGLQIILMFYRFTMTLHGRGRHDAQDHTCRTPCPYRSPLSTSILAAVMLLGRALVNTPSRLSRFKNLWAEFENFSPERFMSLSHEWKTNEKALARALKWVIAELSPELNQDIPRDVYHALHNAVDRRTSCAVLWDWAELTGETQNLKPTVDDLRSTGDNQVLYDLLLERLLRKFLPVHENRKLLLELQVRCLNTLGNRELADMEDVFSEAARNCYYYLLENKDASSLNKDGLLFLSVMALIKFYNRLYDHRRTPSSVADYIGSVLDAVIRHTQVKDENAPLCYQILNGFKLMLEEADQSNGSNFYCLVPQVLRRLDLHAIKQWEMNIPQITGTRIPLVDGTIIPFMEKLAIGQRAEAGQVKCQLDAFHKNRTWIYECAL